MSSSICKCGRRERKDEESVIFKKECWEQAEKGQKGPKKDLKERGDVVDDDEMIDRRG